MLLKSDKKCGITELHIIDIFYFMHTHNSSVYISSDVLTQKFIVH